MNDRKRSITQAAITVYTTKGVRAATMSDVAKAAGVTRQTVYNIFPNTDAVLHAAVRLYVDEQWQKICDRWQTCETLGEKLDILLHHFAVEPWEYMHQSPEAAQLERGYNAAGRAALDEARAEFHVDIANLFSPWADQLHQQGTSPEQVALHISAAIEGVKQNNTTRDGLLAGLATLKASLIALTKCRWANR